MRARNIKEGMSVHGKVPVEGFCSDHQRAAPPFTRAGMRECLYGKVLLDGIRKMRIRSIKGGLRRQAPLDFPKACPFPREAPLVFPKAGPITRRRASL